MMWTVASLQQSIESGLRNPPGPSGGVLFGHFSDFVRDPLRFLAKCSAEYGDVTAFRLPGVRFFLLTDPDDIGRVFAETNTRFINHGGMRLPLSRKLFGNGLLTSEGDSWKRQRLVALPFFRHTSVEKLIGTMIRETRRSLAEFSGGDVIDALDLTTRVAMRVFTNTLIRTRTAGTDEIIESFLGLKEGFRLRHRIQCLGLLMPLPVGLRERRTVARLDRVVRAIIADRRREQTEEDDLLAALMSQLNEAGGADSEQLLESQIKTFLFTGVFGAALPLAWALYLIARDAESQERLASDAERANASANGPEFVREAGFASAVLKETLRLYPPIWASGREATEDTEIGGFSVPRGTQLVLSQWVTHRDPRFWEEPERFVPGRWERKGIRPKYAYFPHGGGPRYCMGEAFADSLAAVLLSLLAERFKLERVASNVGVVPSYALFPDRPLLLKLIPRNSRRA